jgi:hypothetical protein
VERLSHDLTTACGRGFSKSNLFLMRAFYLAWRIFQTSSGKFEARVAEDALTTKCPDHVSQGLRSTVKATLLELQFQSDLR